MNLYELSQLERHIEVFINEETGEFDVAGFEASMDALQDKREAYIKLIKNTQADVKAYKEEASALLERAKSKQALVDRLSDALRNSLTGGEEVTADNKPEFESVVGKVTFRRSTKVELTTDEADFINWAILEGRNELIKYKAPEISKTSIKDALNNGTYADMPAKLVDNYSMSIK